VNLPGNPTRVSVYTIAACNAKFLTSYSSIPDEIFTGWVLKIPAKMERPQETPEVIPLKHTGLADPQSV
jgi:hypothetical protein